MSHHHKKVVYPPSNKGKEKSTTEQVHGGQVSLPPHENKSNLLTHPVKSKTEASSELLERNQEKEELVAAAVSGVIKVDLQGAPQAKLTFGHWNPRPIHTANLNEMVHDFTSGGCRPWISPLVMIAAEGEFVDEQMFCSIGEFCRQTMEDVMALPQLIPGVGLSYKMAAGHHRFQAAGKAFATMKESLKVAKKELEVRRGTTEGDGEHVVNQEEDDSAIRRCEREIELLEGWCTSVQWWPVVVYDSGLYLVKFNILVDLLDS